MRRQEILNQLTAHMSEMAQRFDVARLSVFGSAGRDELRRESDVDIMVRFRHEATFRGFFALKRFLEQLLGREVDLATENMLKPAFIPYIEKDLIHVP